MNTETKKYKEIQYAVRYPNNYKKGEKYPVIMFFHGAGSRGEDISAVINNAYFKVTEIFENFPFITVAPLCCKNTWFDLFEQIENLVLKIADEPFCDKERIYLMGASMGGYCVWQLAMSMPEYFAAAVPICSGGMYWNAGRLINIPIWAFHGAKDTTVYPEESKKMTDAVNQNGGTAKLTVYPDNAHDAWSDTYSNYNVFKWLLEHKNNNINKIGDRYKDATLYG